MDFAAIIGAKTVSQGFDVNNKVWGDSTYKEVQIKAYGADVTIKIKPIGSLDYNYNYGQNKSQGKKVGFTLAPSSRSNLLVDVYRSPLFSDAFNEQIKNAKNAGY